MCFWWCSSCFVCVPGGVHSVIVGVPGVFGGVPGVPGGVS